MSDVLAMQWCDDSILILDQTLLPCQECYLDCRSLEDVAMAIESLSIRGAPAIGVVSAMALSMEANKIKLLNAEDFLERFNQLGQRLLATRPTAVNLRWAVKRMTDIAASNDNDFNADSVKALLKKEAIKIYEEDVAANIAIGRYGQEIVPANAKIMTICNTGSLATAGYGTALGVIRSAQGAGKGVFVVVCETRPLMQGSRLTAWELKKDNIPFQLITDSMAGYYMKERGVDLVIAGADRIAANGDTANKIGTYSLAVLAKEHKIPFYIAAPLSTIDISITKGDEIPIEERSPDEITCFAGTDIAPCEIKVWNPAFDIVPGTYINGIITERGIINPNFSENIKKACKEGESINAKS